MKKTNMYLILSFVMNMLFWITVVILFLVIAAISVVSIDSSILQEKGNLQMHIGVFDFHLTEVSPYLALMKGILFGIGGVFSAVMFWNFKVLFRNTGNGQLFVRSNAKAIFTIGTIMLISSLVSNIPKVYVANKVAPRIHLTHGNLDIVYSVNTPLLYSSIFILLLGVFFNKAIKIAKENELTI
ncbi:DUF2975 domain-containing protein [Peribacillus sp. NPDC097295]|uniref:DUF2975 domain-containing protein n=1 Tax=Peribacillus sp. NPDC097295 TaxID=3364402 RepID=UPI0038058B9F